jgi:DNA-binding winged helix-turn-helix (wHTH) protein
MRGEMKVPEIEGRLAKIGGYMTVASHAPRAPKCTSNAAHQMKLRERVTSSSFDSSEESFEPHRVGAHSGSISQAFGTSIAFGPFRLYASQRLLLEGDKPLRLGSRALDILIALLERPSEVVSKQELIARVWSGITVQEANLKVHVAALRRTLRDGQAGNRYISTVSGRGYCFVASVIRSEARAPNTRIDRLHDLPGLMPSAPCGDDIGTLAAQLSQQNFITMVGAGDMAIAIFLAAVLMADYQHGVLFADLAQLRDRLLVPSAVCAAFGLEITSCDPLTYITAFLEGKQMLLVLDNCRDVAEAAAAFAASVHRRAPGVLILAISR